MSSKLPAAVPLRRDRADHEAWFRALVDTVATGIYIWDGERVVFANEEMERLSGYSRAVLESRGYFASLWHQEDEELIRAHGDARLRGEDVSSRLQARMVHATGAVHWVELNSRLIDQAGRRQVLVAVRDVTDERAALQALRASEARFRAVVETAPVGMFTWDGRLPDVLNDAFLEMTGYTRERYAEPDFLWSILHPDDLDVVRDRAQRRLAGEQVETHYPIRIVRPDGEVRQIDCYAGTVTHGTRLKSLVMMQDVTDRARAEAELAASEARWRAAFLANPVPSLIFSVETRRILSLNAAWEDLTGFTLSEVETGVEAAYAQDEGLRGAVEALARGEGAIRGREIRVGRRDGSARECLVSVEIIIFGGEPCGLAMFTDVTDLKREQEERRRLEISIQQAQKLESLGVLAGGVAHDFNNLLMTILGNASLARLDLPEGSTARRSVDDIEVAAQRAADLTRQMLDYAGKGAVAIHPINLSRLVQEIAQLLEVSIGRDCIVRYRFAPDLPAFEGDATQVRQVAMNLLTNAADAMDGAGVITLETGVRQATVEYLAANVAGESLPPGEYVYLEVVDTGAGMDDSTRSRIFDPFFTTKFTGRGLGLAAVLGIVRGHRGAIMVDSEPGRGSTFTVLFPIAPQRHTATMVHEREPAPWRGEGRLLVVDDDPVVAEVTARLLARMGFDPVLAASGQEACELFRQDPSGIRAVILDLTMPGMGGDATFAALRQIDPHVRVLLSSGYTESEAVGRVHAEELAGFIQKPFGSEELINALRTVLGE
jgi:PAS domain S-box-containing protein